MSIVISILGFSFLVFIHELGHFLFARLTGMKVEKFSIGFGPALYKFGTDTVYQIALFPFGGYVQIKGLNPEPQEAPPPATSGARDLVELERAWGAGGSFSPIEEFEEAARATADPEVAPQGHQVEQLLAAETEEERLAREAEELEGSFLSKSLGARFLVVSGGPLFNALFTLLVFGAMFSANSAFNFQGTSAPSLVVSEVSGAASAAGLLRGDVILRVNQQELSEFHELRELTRGSEGETLKLLIARPPNPEDRYHQAINLHQRCRDELSALDTNPDASAHLSVAQRDILKTSCEERSGLMLYRVIHDPAWPQLTLNITPENLAPVGKAPRYLLGVAPERSSFGGETLWVDARLAWGELIHLVEMMSGKIAGALRGDENVEVASVVKITAISADTLKRGNDWFIHFLAFLSLNLAFLNLLPFPALDGGRLIFLGIEALTRRPVPPKFEMMVHAFGIMMLLLLTVWVTAKDIISLYQ